MGNSIRFLWGPLVLLAACSPAIPGTDDQRQGQLGDTPTTRKYALVVGGAATADTPIDYFGHWTAREVAALDGGGYATTVLFNDGLNDVPIQAPAMAQLSNRPGGLPSAFTAANFKVELSRLVARARQGDEVLIVVATHGFACQGWKPPAGSDPNVAGPEDFCIALGAPAQRSGYAEFHFDDLRPYLAELEAHGVTTAILVSTCDAGNALRVAGPRTCVMSATGYDTSHRTAFFDSYLDHARSGMTMRQAYQASVPYTNDYDHCDGACPDDFTKLCPAPCASSDTPWLSAEKGYADAPCDEFVL